MNNEHHKDKQYDVHIDKFDSELFAQLHHQNTIDTKDVSSNLDTSSKESKKKFIKPLLEREQSIADIAMRSIVFSSPLISRENVGIVGRGTINVIQGAFGSHKSRLAEMLAALMLKNDSNNSNQFLGFQRLMSERFCVCYIDTERNQREELPFAVQGIKLKAGLRLEDKSADFRFTSIKAVERIHRFDAIEEFICDVRAKTLLHIFCLIDVVTDALGDFNDARESMRLHDFIGNLCDSHNVTFLLVIHQNPGTDKARGHTGTEAANKASTVIQIGFEKTNKDEDSELIKLRYLKLRQGRRPEPVFLQYSENNKGLILANSELITSHIKQNKQKADTDEIADRLASLLLEGALPKSEVWKTLESEFDAGNKTIRERLKSIMGRQLEIYDQNGRVLRLEDYTEGRNQFFRLVPAV